MINIGIIAGGGKLPHVIGQSLINRKFNVVFFVIKEFYSANKYKDLNVHIINLTSVKKIIKLLKDNNIENIIMAGNIARPSLSDLSLDYQTFKIAKNLLFNQTGDNKLLLSIKKIFSDNGFKYFNWKDYCPDLFSDIDNLTVKKPSKKALNNLIKGLSIFKTYGRMDVGQSLIVQNNIILGLEAIEGTDNLIIRCKNLKKSGDKGVLVKLSKYNQSDILDIPTIGDQTINLLKENNYEGVFIEKNNCLIIDKQKTIDLANQHNVFISTCNKVE